MSDSITTSQASPAPGGIVRVRPAPGTLTVQKLPYFVGISARSADSTGISMYLLVVPPRARGEAHIHQGYETAIYVLEGRVETRFGEGLTESVISQAGDFVFVPPGVPHQPINLSDREPARAIVARNAPDERENVIPYRFAQSPPGKNPFSTSR